MIGVSLLVAQQFSGQPSVLAYSRVLFEAAGWTGHASVVTVVIMGLTSNHGRAGRSGGPENSAGGRLHVHDVGVGCLGVRILGVG